MMLQAQEKQEAQETQKNQEAQETRGKQAQAWTWKWGDARERIRQGLRGKWFRKDNLIILILLGILLFIIALPTKEGGQGEEDLKGLGGLTDPFRDTVQSASVKDGIAVETPGKAGEEGNESALEEYAIMQEAKLEALLSSMEGVGKVEVMLTFLSSEELVVEKDAPVVRSNTVEKDSEGGTRTVTQYESGDSTVYLSGSGVSEPYVVKTLNPRVVGVLVVAEGAGDDMVRGTLSEIVQALFGVEAQRVKVVPMRTAQG